MSHTIKLFSFLVITIFQTNAYAARFFILLDNSQVSQENISIKKFDCQTIASSLPKKLKKIHQFRCLNEKNSDLIALHLAELKDRKDDFYLHIKLLSPKKAALKITSLRHDKQLQNFPELSREIDLTSPNAYTFLNKLSVNFIHYALSQRALKEWTLTNAIHDSKKITLSPDGQYYKREIDEKLTEIPFAEAYQLFKNENDRQKHYLTATLEIAGLLSIGTLGYISMDDLNGKDQEYTWKEFRKRWTTTNFIRYDDNAYEVNVGHAVNGASFYLPARTNGLNSFESFMLTLAASAVWEFIVEYREVVSINDSIVTPIGGLAIGEAFYQLSNFYATSKNTLLNKVLSGIFASPGGFNLWKSSQVKRKSKFNKFGLREDIWHKFNLSLGTQTTLEHSSSKLQSQHNSIAIGFDSEIYPIPSYDKVGKAKALITDTTYSEFTLKAAIGDKGLDDFLFLTKVMLLGHYQKNISHNKNNQLTGYQFLIGPTTAFSYRDRGNRYGKDWQAVVNVLGPRLDFTVFFNGVKLTGILDVYGDFAMLRNFALNDYKKENSLEGSKSVLKNENYYYAYGISKELKVFASFKNFKIGASRKSSSFNSLEGHDRSTESVTDDIEMRDWRSTESVWIAYLLPKKNLQFKLNYQIDKKRGEIGRSTKETKRATVSRISFEGELIF